MFLGFFRMQHGRDAAEDDLYPASSVLVGDGPAALDLAGKHHGDADEVDRTVEVDAFDVLVDEFYIHIRRKRGGENHRTVRRQVEFGLPGQLGPLGIDEAKLHVRDLPKWGALRPKKRTLAR